MIDPTFGREPFNGGRLEVSDAEVDPEFPGQSDPDRRPPSSFLFPSFHNLCDLLSTKVAMPTMVAPNLPTAPSLPCLKTDLCPDRSLEAETAGLKMVTKKWQIGSFWGRRPNVFFLYRTIWDAHCIDQTSSDWSLPSSTFVCIPNILL